MAAHDAAVARGEDGYVDPDTGLFVFTARYLASRPCCGNGCRHCPWGRERGRLPGTSGSPIGSGG